MSELTEVDVRTDEERAEDEEIARIDAGESAWTDDTELEFHIKKPLGKVVPVRLSDEHWQQLYAEAHERGVGPSTLMRMWVLEKLRAIREGRQSA